jgi:hypothetical protein
MMLPSSSPYLPGHLLIALVSSDIMDGDDNDKGMNGVKPGNFWDLWFEFWATAGKNDG